MRIQFYHASRPRLLAGAPPPSPPAHPAAGRGKHPFAIKGRAEDLLKVFYQAQSLLRLRALVRQHAKSMRTLAGRARRPDGSLAVDRDAGVLPERSRSSHYHAAVTVLRPLPVNVLLLPSAKKISTVAV